MRISKLSLNRETLVSLTPSEAETVQGAMPPRAGFSEMRGCSLGGGVCTSGCPVSAGSGCCPPTEPFGAR